MCYNLIKIKKRSSEMWEEMSYNKYGKTINRLEDEYEPEIDDENYVDNCHIINLLNIKLELVED